MKRIIEEQFCFNADFVKKMNEENKEEPAFAKNAKAMSDLIQIAKDNEGRY